MDCTISIACLLPLRKKLLAIEHPRRPWPVSANQQSPVTEDVQTVLERKYCIEHTMKHTSSALAYVWLKGKRSAAPDGCFGSGRIDLFTYYFALLDAGQQKLVVCM